MSAKDIQAVALKHFSQKGYDGTTLGDIADEVGIKKPSIYAHYTSKSDLFQSVVHYVADDYNDYWQRMLGETAKLDFKNRLHEIFFRVLKYFVYDRVKMNFWARVWMFPPEECSKETLALLRNLNDSFLEKITSIFQEALDKKIIDRGEAKNLAYGYFCFIDGSLMRAICYSDLDYEKHLPILWEYFWLGLGLQEI